MRCPLCDGPVVNGRCKDCGMPYRNDEILYHLNESRSDHYQHATDKARKIMREQQKPQGTPKRTNGAAKSGAGRAAVSRQAMQEQQRKIRQEAMQKMSAPRNTAGTTERYTGKPKKRSRFVWVWIILILVISLAPAFGDFKDMIQDVVSSQSGSENTYTDTEDLDTYFSAEQDDDGYMFYSLAAGNGPVTAGVQIEAGKYGIYTIDEKAVVVVTSKDGKNKERYPLKSGDDTLLVTLDEGDTIEAQSEDDPNVCIYLMEWVN